MKLDKRFKEIWNPARQGTGVPLSSREMKKDIGIIRSPFKRRGPHQTRFMQIRPAANGNRTKLFRLLHIILR